MNNAARVDEIWDDACFNPKTRPHMETNRWVNPVVPTERVPQREKPTRYELDFHGCVITWEPHGDRPFPEPVLASLLRLEEFMRLPSDWDSYGGRPLSEASIKPAVSLILLGHQWASQPRLVPFGDGGVGARWARNGRELEIDVSGNGAVEGLLERDGETLELPENPTEADIRTLVEQFHTDT